MHECEVCQARYTSALAAARWCADADTAEDRPRRHRLMED